LIYFPNVSKDVRISKTRIRPIYLLTQAPSFTQPQYYDYLPPLRTRVGTHIRIEEAMPDYRWNSSKRYWYIEEDRGYQWGILSLWFDHRTWGGNGVCLLFSRGYFERGFELWSSTYTKEVGLISQSSSGLGFKEVWYLFAGDPLSRKTNCIMVSRDQKQRTMAMGSESFENDEYELKLELWTEKNAKPLDFFSPRTAVPPSIVPSSIAPSPISSTNCSDGDQENAGSDPETSPQ
jgi:hypothetical protein